VDGGDVCGLQAADVDHVRARRTRETSAVSAHKPLTPGAPGANGASDPVAPPPSKRREEEMMIEFPQARVERVQALLRQRYSPEAEDDWAFEPVHRTLAQSYKVDRAITDCARLVGAVAYLFTGEPEEFDKLDADAGLREAERIFRDGPPEVPSRSLLLDHARAVLTVKPRPKGPDTRPWVSYIDYEPAHLTLLGGRELFLRTVQALVQPYAEPQMVITFAQAAFLDVGLWLRPKVVKAALASAGRRWPNWKALPPG
jgi:hypothetical protein